MRLCLALLSALFAVVSPVHSSSLTYADEWTEPGGGPGRTRSVDELRAPLTAPMERWKFQCDELLGEPVSQGGTIYVVGRRGKKARVYMLDTETGEELDSAVVASGDFGHVSVLGATVIVVTPSSLYHFERRGDALRRAKLIRGAFSSPAALVPQLALVFKDTALCVYDLRSYRVLHELQASTGKPSVLVSGNGATAFVASNQDDDAASLVVGVRELQVTNLGSKDMEFRDLIASTAASTETPEQSTEVVLMVTGSGHVNYLAAGPRPVRSMRGGGKRFFYGGPDAKRSLPALDLDPCFANGRLFGRTAGGDVVEARMDGGGRGVISRVDRPEGAVDGSITAAGGVLMLGNWALDPVSARILWVAPDMKLAGPLIPVADGVVLYSSGQGVLVCAGDVNADAGASTAALRPELPGSSPQKGGLILIDGQRLPGKAVVASDGAVTLLGREGADDQSFEADHVSAIEAGGELTVFSGGYGVLLAGRAALQRAYAEALLDVAASFAKRRLVADARRVLEEAKALGLPERAARKLAATLSGKGGSTAGNRDQQLRAGLEKEVKARQEGLSALLGFAEWCMAQGLALEGTAALALVPDYIPGRPDLSGIDGETKALMVALAAPHIPAELPLPAAEKSALEWIAWANELAPSGARFVDADAVIDRRRAAPIDGQPRPVIPASRMWREHTLALQTKNILLLTRSHDPSIVGACLSNGEGAVRTLESVLGGAPMEGDERMELRIHKTRKDFLAEDLGDGERASDRFLGFYSPSLRVSRFYVPDGAEHGGQGRALHEVVAHELTHQYIAERWRRVARGKRTATTPGFWIVEGFARYIEDQSLEISRRGDGMDDYTVQSVESATELFLEDAGIKLKDLFMINQLQFRRDVPDEPFRKVKLKSTMAILTHTGKTAFYDQAAAVVFFMMNRAGPGGRAALLSALMSHYKGETAEDGWKALGFETVEAMERDLKNFLKSPQSKS